MDNEQHTSPESWEGRPKLAFAVRMVVMAAPVAVAVATSLAVSRRWPRPPGLVPAALWLLALTVLSIVVLVAVERVARRLLPLAALLKLSMVFPDRAPSRLRLALRSGSVRKLESRVHHARHAGLDDDPTKAAEEVLVLVGAMNVHDRLTRGHSERVRAFNDLLAQELELSAAERDRLRWAALLHDVGKLTVPHRLLNKTGKPTAREWEVLMRHPDEGARIIAPLRAWLGPSADAVGQHHERFDGAGYPSGLRGEEISRAARIVAVADAFEVMTATRPYKRPVKAEAARQELARCAGSHFDPAVVRAFLNLSLGRLHLIIGPLSWLAQFPFLGTVPRWEVAAANFGYQAATAAGTVAGVGALAVSGAIGPAVAVAAEREPATTTTRVAAADEPVEDSSLSSPSPATPAPPVQLTSSETPASTDLEDGKGEPDGQADAGADPANDSDRAPTDGEGAGDETSTDPTPNKDKDKDKDKDTDPVSRVTNGLTDRVAHALPADPLADTLNHVTRGL